MKSQLKLVSVQMSRVLLVVCMFVGLTGSDWSFHHPSDNSTLPSTNAHGTGGCPPLAALSYRLYKADGTLNGKKDGVGFDGSGG
jgi:hypothetical protein